MFTDIKILKRKNGLDIKVKCNIKIDIKKRFIDIIIMSQTDSEIEFSQTDSDLTDYDSDSNYTEKSLEPEPEVVPEPEPEPEVVPEPEHEHEVVPEPIDESDFNINMGQYQQNVNQFMKVNHEDIEFTLKALPFTFHPDSESLFYKNNGAKVILPKHVLYKLSEYENVCFPVTLKIKEDYMGVLEFAEFIDEMYIPNHLFYKLDIEENSLLSFSVIHKELPKATYIKIKPLDERFYTIENVKKYFEIHLKKLFNVLSQDQFISIPFADTLLPFIVTECKPEKNVSIDEIEELELDIDAMCEPKVMSAEKVEEPIDPVSDPDPDPKPEFKSFSGKARSLKD